MFFQSPRSVFLFHLYFPIPSEEAGPDLFIRDMNERLRRVDVAGQSEMSRWLPQAIKCSLKDIVPADLVSGGLHACSPGKSMTSCLQTL